MNKILISKFLKKQCDPQEERELMEWLKSSGHKELENFIEEDLNEELAKEIATDKELCHLLPAIIDSEEQTDAEYQYGQSERVITIEQSVRKRKREVLNVVKWAASIILIAGFSYVYYSNLNNTQNDQLEENIDLVTKVNQRGRKSTLHLKDGSIVYLNSESKITYSSLFSDSIRTVHLEGEAFFDVAKDASRPFLVKTGPITVKVLGTSFNVRSFSETEQIKISIVDGQVEVLKDNESLEHSENIILAPNQSVIYQRDNDSFNEITSFNSDEDVGWKDGILYFDKAGLIAVVNKLERWYNVQFEIKNDPKSMWSYTGKFQNETLENVLFEIGFTEGFTYKIENDNITIKFKTIKL